MCVGHWVVFFWYPLDFTFVCPTEIIAFGVRYSEFEALNAKVIGASCDSVYSHLQWCNTARADGGLGDMKIPLLADYTKEVATKYGVLLPDGSTLRATFLISPQGILKQITMNDLPVGRNVDEFIRLIKAFQYNEKYGDVCPANWQPGDQTMKADPNGSKEYFASAASTTGSGLAAGGSRALVNGEFTPVVFALSRSNARRNKGLLARIPDALNALASSSSSLLESLMKSYKSQLIARPLQTKAITSCVISVIGELIGTYIKVSKLRDAAARRAAGGSSSSSSGPVSLRFIDNISGKRVAMFGIYGFAITGTSRHVHIHTHRIWTSHCYPSVPLSSTTGHYLTDP